jgi:hypothetical protein
LRFAKGDFVGLARYNRYDIIILLTLAIGWLIGVMHYGCRLVTWLFVTPAIPMPMWSTMVLPSGTTGFSHHYHPFVLAAT